MCSIAMPAELLLGHSPPVYSSLLYSPLVAPTIASRSVPPRIRPCLSSGSLAIDSIRNNNDGGSNKQKKRVVFADDRGRPLTQVLVLNSYLVLIVKGNKIILSVTQALLDFPLVFELSRDIFSCLLYLCKPVIFQFLLILYIQGGW